MKKGQNLIEFIYIFPILIFLMLGVFEIALYWRDVNMVENINNEIISNAILAPYANGQNAACPGALAALEILKKKETSFAPNHQTYTTQIIKGTEPYAHYRFIAESKKITLDFDCQNPYSSGLASQLNYIHPLQFIGAKLPSFGRGEPIEIFPSSVNITSSLVRLKAGY